MTTATLRTGWAARAAVDRASTATSAESDCVLMIVSPCCELNPQGRRTRRQRSVTFGQLRSTRAWPRSRQLEAGLRLAERAPDLVGDGLGQARLGHELVTAGEPGVAAVHGVTAEPD